LKNQRKESNRNSESEFLFSYPPDPLSNFNHLKGVVVEAENKGENLAELIESGYFDSSMRIRIEEGREKSS
jgi:hypothetical protein